MSTTAESKPNDAAQHKFENTNLGDEYELYKMQVAGHRAGEQQDSQKNIPPEIQYYKEKKKQAKKERRQNGCFESSELGVLLHKPTKHVLKPAQRPPRGQREIGFYCSVYGVNTGDLDGVNLKIKADKLPIIKDPLMSELAPFVPAFFGCRQVRIDDHDYIFIEMDDITRAFKKPCIMDVKIGAVTWDPEASPEKVAYEKVKCPIMQSLGFRLLGIQGTNADGEPMNRGRGWSIDLTEKDIVPALRDYIGDRSAPYRKRIIDEVLEQIRSIEAWFSKQRLIKIYSSSLLIVFEGDERAAPSDGHAASVRMIDFTHVFDAAGERDDNYLNGLRGVREHWQRLSSLE